MAPKLKYYVVWRGREPGIYTLWEECQEQVKGFPEACYKSFTSLEEANRAYNNPPPLPPLKPDGKTTAEVHPKLSYNRYLPANPPSPPDYRNDTVLPLPPEVTADAWAVDAACSGNPGPMEYQGIDLATGQRIFHFGPIRGTNNIGEFLAIVHALALMQKMGIRKVIYTDSRNALLWIKARKCRTKLAQTPQTAEVHNLISRAEYWLNHNDFRHISIRKWETERWGEVPADFGRK